MKNINVSSETLARQGMLIALVGPTGGGKTTFTRRLLEEQGEDNRLMLSVSITTRDSRPNEIDGESYFFVSRQEFEKKVENQELFEWEEVHGNLYGTPRKTIESALDGVCDLLLDIDIKGALSLKKQLPQNTLIVFIMPPSLDIQKARLLGRGPMNEDELKRRLETANREYQLLLSSSKEWPEIDYLVLNNDAEDTFSSLRSILSAEKLRFSRIKKDAVKELCIIMGGSK